MFCPLFDECVSWAGTMTGSLLVGREIVLMGEDFVVTSAGLGIVVYSWLAVWLYEWKCLKLLYLVIRSEGVGEGRCHWQATAASITNRWKQVAGCRVEMQISCSFTKRKLLKLHPSVIISSLSSLRLALLP